MVKNMASLPVELRFFAALRWCSSGQRKIDIPEVFGNEILDLSVSLNDETKGRKLTWALGKMVGNGRGDDIKFN